MTLQVALVVPDGEIWSGPARWSSPRPWTAISACSPGTRR